MSMRVLGANSSARLSDLLTLDQFVSQLLIACFVGILYAACTADNMRSIEAI